MSRTYYPLWYRLDHTDGYLIWFSNEHDGVVTLPDETVPSFPRQEALRSYASSHQMELDATEPLLHDLDLVAQWIGSAFSPEIDCSSFLGAWNLFADLAISVNGDFDSDRIRTMHVYEKLFRGNNLPAVTPPGMRFTPQWSDDELMLMREILRDGLELFRKHVRME